MHDGPPKDAVAELGDDDAAQEQTEEELEKMLHSARECEAAEKPLCEHDGPDTYLPAAFGHPDNSNR